MALQISHVPEVIPGEPLLGIPGQPMGFLSLVDEESLSPELREKMEIEQVK